MMLPTLEYPIFEVNLLSIGKVKFRPFLVKEQKLLLMAVEAKDAKTTIDTIKQIVQNCLINPVDVDVDALPLVDLEILFMNLRARSMGEVMNVFYECENQITETGKCGMIIEVGVNLLEVPVVNKDLDKKLIFSEDIGVVMKYPSFDLMSRFIKDDENTEAEYIIAANCIDYIYDKDNVYKASDAKEEELISFIDNLPDDKYQLIKNFIENSPVSKIEIEKKCPKCGYDHKFKLEGLNDFFI